ncbi:VOC family protein [Myceligenerans pegani]|uniref:VOC family protein n=1 Tax=Myceligenerans pegani TaxID=2776917 RepID=A0ABR9N4P3_9MICO|nr:VOC family protein [Myceligenerans sp. TRM 65318]MBE1878246.1 VOC family protein [Myceligenerans sp. TRM 65318]MBE3020517.1 VOC family protein [Myceligenerans sp. TRM 65318]
MLTTLRGFSSFSVRDTAEAATFYRDVLGLVVRETPMGLEIDATGGSPVFVYAKGDAHEPASFTVLNLIVPDIDMAVDQLAESGTSMLRYPEFGQDERGVARSTDPSQGPTIAWIADPSGNVVGLIEA